MGTISVIQVPQWQGAHTPRAGLLAQGSELLASTLPDARILRVPVPDTSGEERSGVRSLDLLTAVAAETRSALASTSGLVVTVGGDCGVELVPVSAALERYGDDLAVVWFDAHGDLNTPETSPSHAFHGMVLRTLMGEGPQGLVGGRALSPARTVLAGARALDPAELTFVADRGIAHLTVAELTEDPGRLTEAVGEAKAVYVHIDLDVLDPGGFGSLNCPEPGGLSVQALQDAVRTLTDRFTLAGLGITEYTPVHTDDQKILEGLVPALV